MLSADSIRRELLQRYVRPARLSKVPLEIDGVILWFYVTWTPHPIYRGGRLFFLCFRCTERVARLYQTTRGSEPLCRRCLGLTYRSTQSSCKLPLWLAKELEVGGV